MTHPSALITQLYSGDTITASNARKAGIKNPIQCLYEIRLRHVPIISTWENGYKVYRIDPSKLPQIKDDVCLFQTCGTAAFDQLKLERYICARYISRALARTQEA